MSHQIDEMIFNIPSDFKFLGAVDAAVQDLAREFAFSQDAINDVSTALIEACSNAIEHGNKFDPDKRVEIALKFDGNAFISRVTDQGGGFDFESSLDSDAPVDPLSVRGRGLIIMKAFSDDLKFSYDGGLRVELVKTREESEEASAETSE